MSFNLYWGDLHNHCSISYGHGTVEQALLRAREQLDFCSITGHAFWPDMPTDRATYAEIIDYHNIGFARCARNWDKLIDQQRLANSPGEFMTFPSYEWHSLKYGDHNVYSMGPELTLQDTADLPALRSSAKNSGAIAIPHHIGYAAGFRGINWDHYRENVSPFVEIFSLHGCSVSDNAPYPMLHDMGPRDAGSTAVEGWARGFQFGIVGGTDHHAAYPGSHGDGRMGVYATDLTREALWDAFLARRVFAASGDRIDARLFVDDAWTGSGVSNAGTRHVKVAVRGSDSIQLVEVLKNERVVQRLFPKPDSVTDEEAQYRLRITWGWGRKNQVVDWDIRVSLVNGGTIRTIETCFSGQPIVAPKEQTSDEEVPDDFDLPHAIVERTDRSCTLQSKTKGNPTMRHSTTQGISFEIKATSSSDVVVEANGQSFRYSLSQLQHAARSQYLRGWLSEAIRIGPLVPIAQCKVDGDFFDEPEDRIDVYRMQVFQHNGQCAWTSPIWVES